MPKSVARIRLMIGAALFISPMSLHVFAQVPGIGSTKCSINGRPVPCDDSPSSDGSARGAQQYSVTAPFKRLLDLFGGHTSSTRSSAPIPADVAFNRGVAAEKGQRWQDAEKSFRAALDLEHRSNERVFIHAHLSLIYWKLGRLEDSISAVRAGLRIDPAHQWSRVQLAHLLTDRLAAKKKAGMEEGAEEDYREAMALSPDDPVVKSWARWIEDIQELRRVKEMRTQVLESVNSTSNKISAQGLDFMGIGLPDSKPETGQINSNSNANAASSGELTFAGLDAFKPGNPPAAEVKSELEPQTTQAQAGKSAVSTKAGDQLKSASTLDPNAGSEKQASEEARSTFDTAGRDAGSLPTINIGPEGRPRPVPPEIARDPRYLELKANRDAAIKKYRELENQLTEIRQKKERGEGNKGQLDVQEAQTKDQMTREKSKADAAQINMDTYVVNFKPTNTKSGPHKSDTNNK